MMSVQRNILALVLALLVTLVGLVDAAIGRQGDLVAIFGLAAALQLVALAGLRGVHRPVRLRPDLSAAAAGLLNRACAATKAATAKARQANSAGALSSGSGSLPQHTDAGGHQQRGEPDQHHPHGEQPAGRRAAERGPPPPRRAPPRRATAAARRAAEGMTAVRQAVGPRR
jgi:hypothetical protein